MTEEVREEIRDELLVRLRLSITFPSFYFYTLSQLHILPSRFLGSLYICCTIFSTESYIVWTFLNGTSCMYPSFFHCVLRVRNFFSENRKAEPKLWKHPLSKGSDVKRFVSARFTCRAGSTTRHTGVATCSHNASDGC